MSFSLLFLCLGRNKHAVSRLFLSLVFPLLLLGTAGCSYPRNVLWLPDSKEIIFSEKNGARLVQYALAQKSSKVIVENTNTKTPWPAISPDGKKVAVLKVNSRAQKKDERTVTRDLQVIIYNLDGTESSRSKGFTETVETAPASKDSEVSLQDGMLAWSSFPDKIVAFSAKSSLIYDCRKDSWIEVEKVMPAPTNPICPNGKGFLGVKRDEEEQGEKLILVDWEGRIIEFKDPKILKVPEGDLVGFSWDKNIARFVFATMIVECDVETMTCSQKKQVLSFPADDGLIKWSFEFKTGGRRVCVLEAKPQEKDKTPTQWLETQIPSKQIRKVLVNKGQAASLNSFSFFPSPDGEKLAIRFKKLNPESPVDEDAIIVVDNNGEVLASIRPDWPYERPPSNNPK